MIPREQLVTLLETSSLCLELRTKNWCKFLSNLTSQNWLHRLQIKLFTNLKKHCSKIRNLKLAQKTFINERIIQVLSKLTSQENALKKFRDENRNIIASPALMLQQSRLMREVELQTQVYITLKTQLEMVQLRKTKARK